MEEENVVGDVFLLNASAVSVVKKRFGLPTKGVAPDEATVEILKRITDTIEDMLGQPQYNFFRIGYYVYKNPEVDLSRMPADEANEIAYSFLMDDFMSSFIELEKIAVCYSAKKTLENKKLAVVELENAIKFFRNGNFIAKDAFELCQKLAETVYAAIDPLAVIKDNIAYTFGGAFEREVKKYFFNVKNNQKEEQRFERQTARRDALVAKGKSVDWKVVPKSIVPLDEQIESIVSILGFQ